MQRAGSSAKNLQVTIGNLPRERVPVSGGGGFLGGGRKLEVGLWGAEFGKGSRCQSGVAVLVQDKSVGAVFDDVPCSDFGADDDGQASGHGFEDHHAECVESRKHHEGIGSAVVSLDFLPHRAGEGNGFLDAECPGLGAVFLLIAFADHEQAGIDFGVLLSSFSNRFHDGVETLEFEIHSDEEDKQRFRRDAVARADFGAAFATVRRREFRKFHAGVHDPPGSGKVLVFRPEHGHRGRGNRQENRLRAIQEESSFHGCRGLIKEAEVFFPDLPDPCAVRGAVQRDDIRMENAFMRVDDVELFPREGALHM